MNVLDILLQAEIPQPETKQFKQKRLSKHTGQDVIFTLKEIGFSRVSEIKKRPLESDDMEIHILLASIVEPDLKNTELLAKYKAVTPVELIRAMLRPGEITDLSREAEKLSGYRVTTLEEIKKK